LPGGTHHAVREPPDRPDNARREADGRGLHRRAADRPHLARVVVPGCRRANIWGLDFSHAFGAFALYVEVIFGLPGIGSLTADTLGGFDLPPIVALAVYLGIVVVFASALVDLVVAWLDPRLRRPQAHA
jgi:ABC-type dipeptide/oligopeptide/nickel transport system permease component